MITARRTGDFAGCWGGDHHNGVPIFVPTHQPPAENPFARVHYVTDGIAACVEQAEAAAGDDDVFMHGSNTAQQALKAGVDNVGAQPSTWSRSTSARTPPGKTSASTRRLAGSFSRATHAPSGRGADSATQRS